MKYNGLISCPLGLIKLEASEEGLRSLAILPSTDEDSLESKELGYDAALQPVVEQLQLYFEGKLDRFSVAIDWRHHSMFSCHVLRVVQSIPFGKYRSYQQIAQFLSQPKSARAVGNANRRNPIPIIIPCHRVIGSNGELTGYVYGKEIKRQLLHRENPHHFSNQGQLF